MATAHALWKQMCRFAEDRPFVKLFGADVMQRLSTFAIFDVTDIHSPDKVVQLRDLDYDSDNPIPPFPFPKIVLVIPDAIIALEAPQMDLDTGILEYDSMLYAAYDAEMEKDQYIATCRIRIDTKRTAADRELRAEILNYLSLVDEARPTEHSDASYEREVRKTEELANDERFPEEMREKMRKLAVELRGVQGDLMEQRKRFARMTFLIGMMVVAWINRPKHYIVQLGPEIVRKPGRDKDRIPRLGERERYIMIEHEEVRRRWSAVQGNHASPMPHLRRGHYKTLRAERFGANRGKVVWVSPCHVNGACVEWREGNVSYKVVG